MTATPPSLTRSCVLVPSCQQALSHASMLEMLKLNLAVGSSRCPLEVFSEVDLLSI